MALAPDPDHRYQTAYAMLGDIRRLLAGRAPKLVASRAPVVSQTFSAAELATAVPLPSSEREPALVGAATLSRNSTPAPTRSEWWGNLVLMAAIALLVGFATFVMVRERLSDSLP
jgi:hypothetical protein